MAAETAVSEVDGANGRLIYRGGYLIEDLVAGRELRGDRLPAVARRAAESRTSSTRCVSEMAAARTLNKSARGDAGRDGSGRSIRWTCCARWSRRRARRKTLDQTHARRSGRADRGLSDDRRARAYRRRQGKDVVEPRDDLGHAANLLWMMEGKEPDRRNGCTGSTPYLVLLADHGLNASTFAARVVASTGSDLTSASSARSARSKGPAHGGATFAARTMLDKIGSADNAEKWLTRRPRPPRAVPGLRPSRLPHLRPAGEDPARDGEDRRARAPQDGGSTPRRSR